jgi:hypothetical protein
MPYKFNPFTGTFDDSTPGPAGVVAAANSGTALLPGITFASDPNTGIYNPGADQLAVSTGGTGRLFIDSTGRVGIGLNAPSVPLHVQHSGTGTVATGMWIGDSSTNGNLLILRTGTGEARIQASWQSVGVDSNLTFYTTTAAGASGERARIDASGRLLVGTSSSSDNISLAVAGNSGGITADSKLLLIYKGTIPGDGNTLSSISFGDNSHQSSGSKYAAEIKAQRDGGTWTSGTSMPGRLVFSTTADGASSPTERMRITSNAYVRLAAGTGGIQFNGDTAAANALDDYEEGTWIPTVIGSTTAGTTTHVNQFGRYTKIGRFVSLHFNVSITSMTGTGNLLVSNIPFQYGDVGTRVFPGAVMTSNLDWPSAGSIVIMPTDSSSDLRFFVSSDNAAVQQIAVENSTWEMWCSLSYYVA